MNTTLGKKGEEKAKEFLEQSGYTICHCNWRYTHKEVDIIARYKEILVFIEVKTRRKLYNLLPQEVFTKRKQHFYIECAFAYQEEFNLMNSLIRFDIICIHALRDTVSIEHWRDVIDVREVMGYRYSTW